MYFNYEIGVYLVSLSLLSATFFEQESCNFQLTFQEFSTIFRKLFMSLFLCLTCFLLNYLNGFKIYLFYYYFVLETNCKSILIHIMVINGPFSKKLIKKKFLNWYY